MDDEFVQPNNDPEESAVSSPTVHRFTRLKLKGVGGWLMFFIIGQLVLRPAHYFGNRDTTVITAEIAARFPLNVRIIAVEKTLAIGSLIAGIVVALSLLKTGTKWPVVLAKLYLMMTSLLKIGLAALYLTTDLHDRWRTELITYGIVDAAITSLVCVVWFLYFTRSTRVQATYLEPDI